MLPETIPNHRQLRNVVADRLRQEKLAQELDMSLMPVREAFKELAAERLIRVVSE